LLIRNILGGNGGYRYRTLYYYHHWLAQDIHNNSGLQAQGQLMLLFGCFFLLQSGFLTEFSVYGVQYLAFFFWVTGQFADKLTRSQSTDGLVNLRTSQVAEMCDVKCTNK